MRHSLFFFFNDTATTEIYTLSLHDALPIYGRSEGWSDRSRRCGTTSSSAAVARWDATWRPISDRKSTRLNSSHLVISYAVFFLEKKKNRLFCISSTCVFIRVNEPYMLCSNS